MDSIHCKNVTLYEDLLSEQELVASEPFQRARLRLYCGVPLTDLFPSEPLDEDLADARLDYLICRGTSRVAAIQLLRYDDSSSKLQAYLEKLVSLPICHIGEYELSDTGKLLRWLRPIVNSSMSKSGYFAPHAVTSAMLGPLEQARAVTRSADNKTHMLPTAYGKSLGIIRGYFAQGYGMYRCLPYWSDQTREQVNSVLHPAPVGDESGPIPLAQRISRLKRALPCTERYSTTVAEQFARMPLADYMSAYPEQLSEIQNKFVFDDPPRTVGQAAELVYGMFQSNANSANGRELMQLLAHPIVYKIKCENGEVK